MGFMERALTKIKYIIGGPNSIETSYDQPIPPGGIDIFKADQEAAANTKALIDQAKQTRESQANAAKAKLEAEAQRRQLAVQGLRDEEAVQLPTITHVQLAPWQTEEVIKNADRLNTDQLNHYVNHLTQKKKK